MTLSSGGRVSEVGGDDEVGQVGALGLQPGALDPQGQDLGGQGSFGGADFVGGDFDQHLALPDEVALVHTEAETLPPSRYCTACRLPETSTSPWA